MISAGLGGSEAASSKGEGSSSPAAFPIGYVKVAGSMILFAETSFEPNVASPNSQGGCSSEPHRSKSHWLLSLLTDLVQTMADGKAITWASWFKVFVSHIPFSHLGALLSALYIGQNNLTKLADPPLVRRVESPRICCVSSLHEQDTRQSMGDVLQRLAYQDFHQPLVVEENTYPAV